MRRLPLLSSNALIVAPLSASAYAGPMADAETALRGAYASYRVALFATNSGIAEKCAISLESFANDWADVMPILAVSPQYADDPQAASTYVTVAEQIARASAVAAMGDLAVAHL
jgi:hypothetical protein